MTFTDYAKHDGLALADLVARQEVSPAELVEAAIAAIERHDPALNAVVLRQFEAARTRAAKPKALPEGPFRGVPTLLKDLGFAEEGVPSGGGSRALQGVVATADSLVVARSRAAGLIFCGRTNTPESGLCATTEPLVHGPCGNPWDTGRTPGGSSGGAAAAVACAMVPLASASDGGGSIRIPAACCGLFGLKPSRHRVSAAPRGESWNGLAVVHAVTRSVRDSAALLDATAGPAPGDPSAAPAPAQPYLEEVSRPPGSLRIAVTAQSFYEQPVAADCLAALADAAALCEALGHQVEEAAPAYDKPALRQAYFTLLAANQAADQRELAALLGREPGPDDLEPWTRRMIAIGAEHSGPQVLAAIRTLHREGRKIGQFHERYDVLLTPTLAQPPIPIGQLDMSIDDEALYTARSTAFSPFTRLANCTGQPAMSLPLYWSAAGLPIGVMFTGRYGEEGLLLSLAGQLEQARPWFHRNPPIFG
ncbi:MAG: amidase [Pseudomonadota bacterium]